MAGTRLGVFVVDTGGPARLMAGPVTDSYESLYPTGKRLDDAAGLKLTAAERPAPWNVSFSSPSVPEPKMSVSFGNDSDPDKPWIANFNTAVALGTVTIDLLDHHRKTLRSFTKSIGKGESKVTLAKLKNVEAVHLRIGDFHRWMEVQVGGAGGSFGGWTYE